MNPKQAIAFESELTRLGLRLRALRGERGWTLDDLAARTSLSAPYLSRVEAGERQPSLAVLLRISQAHGVALSALFEQPMPVTRIVVREEETPMQHGNGLHYASLSGSQHPAGLHPLRIVIPADRQGGELYAHDGEEWLYVLSGRLRLTLGTEEYLVGPGDAAHFDASVPHRLAAEDGEDAEVILVACAGMRPLLSSYL